MSQSVSQGTSPSVRVQQHEVPAAGANVPAPRELAAAFLVAAALILFQVSFTRLISYKLFYHFVFFAISLSLLGLGAAATFVARRARVGGDADAGILRWLALLAPLVPLAFLLMANPVAITHHPPVRTKLLGTDAIAYLLWCAPLMVALNFCGGVVLASLFSRRSGRMGLLYAADLLGAAAGSLACVGLMKFGSPPVAFVSGVVPVVLAALGFLRKAEMPDAERRGIGLGLAAALVAAAGIFVGPSWLRDFSNFRTEGGSLRTVLKYEWNHIIRTDHVPGWYVLDGEAATRIVPWDEKEQVQPVRTPAYGLAPPSPKVAILGSGGGRELSEALRAGASSVLAVDINPTILGWVRGEDRRRTNNLFVDQRVDTQVGEGRHVLRSSGRRFDAIVIHAIDTYAAAASGAYALTENFLYTKEAFEDYYRGLTDRGVLSVSRWLFNPPREDLRLFSTALAALEEMGVKDPRDHLFLAAPVKDYTQLGDRRVWGYLTMSRRPLRKGEVGLAAAAVRKAGWSVLYAPGMATGTPFDQLANAPDREEFARNWPYLVSPVTDASPYLFQYFNPLKANSWTASSDWATSNIYQGSAVMLLVALAVCVVASGVLILLPLWLAGRRAGGGTLTLREGLFFGGLGLGYMALEVPVIQALSMYLGHPVYGFAVVLVSLLVASGVGSLLADAVADRAPLRPALSAWQPCALVALLMLAMAAGLFPFLHATLDLGDPARFAIATALVAACGLPMGMPLALAVQGLGRRDERAVAWAWGVNAAASVVGSCLVMIAMVFGGSQSALAIGAAAYAVAALAGSRRA